MPDAVAIGCNTAPVLYALTTWTLAPHSAAMFAACRTASAAVGDPSVPTTTVRYMFLLDGELLERVTEASRVQQPTRRLVGGRGDGRHVVRPQRVGPDASDLVCRRTNEQDL